MKIEAWNLDPKRCLNPPFQLTCFYGNEKAFKDYWIQALTPHFKPVFLTEKAFLKDPTGAIQPDLFSAFDEDSKQHCLVIEDVQDKHAASYQKIFAEPMDRVGLVLLYGASLKTNSSFINWLQRHPKWFAVPCYPLTQDQMVVWLEKILAFEGLNIPKTWLTTFAKVLKPEGVRNFVAKLSLMTKGGEVPSSPESCLALVNPGVLEQDIAYLLSGGNVKQTFAFVEGHIADTSEALLWFRQSIHHFNLLLQAKTFMEKGIPAVQATERLTQPIFFKYKPAFQERLNRWPLAKLYQALALLARGELILKQSGLVSASIYFLIQIATLVPEKP